MTEEGTPSTLFWHEGGLTVEIMDYGSGSIRVSIPLEISEPRSMSNHCLDREMVPENCKKPSSQAITYSCLPDGTVTLVKGQRAAALHESVRLIRPATSNPSLLPALTPSPSRAVTVAGSAFGSIGGRITGLRSLLPAIRLPGAARRRREAEAAAAAEARAEAERSDPSVLDPGEEVVGHHEGLPPREGLRVVLRARAGRAHPAAEAAYGGGRLGINEFIITY